MAITAFLHHRPLPAGGVFLHNLLIRAQNRMGDTMNNSIWHGTPLPRFETLQRAIKTDVLVIGGGMAGLLCAYQLQNAGVDVVLVEQNRICGGVTGNTTAKITIMVTNVFLLNSKRFLSV